MKQHFWTCIESHCLGDLLQCANNQANQKIVWIIIPKLSLFLTESQISMRRKKNEEKKAK